MTGDQQDQRSLLRIAHRAFRMFSSLLLSLQLPSRHIAFRSLPLFVVSPPGFPLESVERSDQGFAKY